MRRSRFASNSWSWGAPASIPLLTGQKKGPILFSQYQSAKFNKPFRAAQFFGSHFDPLLGLPTTSPWIACRHRSQFRRKRSGDNTVHTSQTHHQDYHPDRTFHGLFLLECGSPGSGNPHAHELYIHLSRNRTLEEPRPRCGRNRQGCRGGNPLPSIEMKRSDRLTSKFYRK
jgi:hypothetical protein